MVQSDSHPAAPLAAADSPADSDSSHSGVERFRISPLIRLTLISLYGALIMPLPFLARVTAAPVSPWALGGAAVIGGIMLHGALSQQVWVDSTGIAVAYPRWISWLWRQQWRLNWSDIKALKPRSTGQGGLVYYFVGADQQAYLLPMRIAGFARLVRRVEAHTGIDTQDIKPLSQPWMYGILLMFTLFLGLVDGWTIWTALHQG